MSNDILNYNKDFSEDIPSHILFDIDTSKFCDCDLCDIVKEHHTFKTDGRYYINLAYLDSDNIIHLRSIFSILKVFKIRKEI